MIRRTFAASIGATLIAPTTAHSASVDRIAIFVASDDNTAAAMDIDRLSVRLGGAFLRTHRYSIVDRARLGSVIREQGFSNSMYADPKTAAALGKIAGASRLLHVMLSITGERNDGAMMTIVRMRAEATYSLVGVDTAKIISEGTAEGEDEKDFARGSPLSDIGSIRRNALDACCDDITQQVITPS
jgi:hypothetical protein